MRVWPATSNIAQREGCPFFFGRSATSAVGCLTRPEKKAIMEAQWTDGGPSPCSIGRGMRGACPNAA